MSVNWNELARLGVTVRPWDGPIPEQGGRRSQFRVTLQKTIRLLHRELEHLGATNIVLELDIRERDIRVDGYPRADARLGAPAVAVSFETKWGPLRYATAEYDDWTDNLRAVALSLEALRAVDRYGVSKRGEQYRGWRQLEAGDGSYGMHRPSEARDFLMRQYGRPEDRTLDDPVKVALRRALFVTHPDHGSENVSELHRVLRAKELLDAA